MLVTYKILSSIVLSKVTLCAEEIIEDPQCGFECNRSANNHMFCIRQILDKKWERSEGVYQLFIDLNKVYDLVRREA